MSVRVLKVDYLHEGVLLERIGRFVVRVRVGGENILAHNTNTGRLPGILSPGKRVLLAPAGGKLRFRLVGVEDAEPGCFSIVDVVTQGKVFERSVELGVVPYFRGCAVVRRHARVRDSRLDYLLSCGGRDVLVETKSALMRGSGGEAMYPDCETFRGRKHIKLLIDLALSGTPTYLVFVAAVCGARCFKPNADGDREVYRLIYRALESGVFVRAISAHLSLDGSVYLDNPDLRLCLENANGTPRL
jgi:sugar fermentation stimulation protein A